jgi:hypothetical protein
MQNGPRYLTDVDLQVLTLLNPSNVPANQPAALHTQYGSIGQTEDGRIFRYTKFAGTSTINPGSLLVAPAAPANSTGLAIVAAASQPANTATGSGTSGTSALAAGSQVFAVTNGATAVTQDEFQFVEILVGSSAANGTYKLRLRGNSKAAANGTVTLYLADPLPPTITTLIPGTDTVNLRYSPWNQPTASTTQGEPVGVTIVSVPQTSTASYAGWIQTRGEAFVNATSGTLGYPVAQDVATNAGYVANIGAGAAETVPQFGYFYTAEASNAASVFLKID